MMYLTRIRESLILNATNHFLTVTCLFYHPDTEKVQKHINGQFVGKSKVQRQTQTDEVEPNDGQDRVMEPIADGVAQENDKSYEDIQESIIRDKNPQSDSSDGKRPKGV